jgi:hypothetical protein
VAQFFGESLTRAPGRHSRLGCAQLQREALPAAPETVAVWLVALASGYGIRKPLARSSIEQPLSAVIMRHRDAGYPVDRKHPAIARELKGIANTKARQENRAQGQASPTICER